MPPSLHPPHPQSHKLKRRHHPASMAKKGLAALLYKLRDVHHHRRSPPSPPSPSTPPASRYGQRCYPPPPSAWPWPSCRHPRTSSFRARPDEANAAAAVFRTVNSVYDERRRSSMSLDDPRSPAPLLMPAAEQQQQQRDDEEEEEKEEMALVVRGVRSERLFFEPAGAEFLPTPKHHCACLTLSSDGTGPPVESSARERLLQLQQPTPAQGDNNEAADKNEDESAAPTAAAPSEKDDDSAAVKTGGAVVVTVETKDPYGDFRASMAEMVAAHGLRDWDAMEELLAWYLKLNARSVHAAIVGAFIDLLVTMQHQASTPPSQSPSSSCITFEGYSSATFDDEDKS
ncbi:hypothetical protein QOZ80_4BG0349700 [Eleusine coracana subsp. coracana]|nr:hypothetical protein QOZ80_4BG0349700 [Eleusine coracana subsp. coracana]